MAIGSPSNDCLAVFAIAARRVLAAQFDVAPLSVQILDTNALIVMFMFEMPRPLRSVPAGRASGRREDFICAVDTKEGRRDIVRIHHVDYDFANKRGSEREFDEGCTLGGFPDLLKFDELEVVDGNSLGLEQ